MGCCISNNYTYTKLGEQQAEKTFLSGLVFGFLTEIIQTGNERPLEENDLSSLECEGTRYLTEKLEGEWQNEMKIQRERGSRPRLWRSLLRATDRKLMAVSVLLAVTASFCRLIQPVVLSFLLEEMTAKSSDSDLGTLCLYSALLSISSFVQVFAVHHCDYALYVISVQVKASLIGLVYKKVGEC